MPQFPQVQGGSDNPWDLLAERFNTHKLMDEIHPDAAVNIYLGWPTFFDQIKSHASYLGKRKLTILDFGCGAGELCKQLHMKGHNVIGIDASAILLNIARYNTPLGIEFCLKTNLHDRSQCSIYNNKIDVVTSMHSLDWIEEVEEVLFQLTEYLVDNGLLLFAVFPKEHVRESLRIHDQFEDFDSEVNPVRGFINFDGIRVPVVVREPDEYETMLKKLGMQKVLEYYPPFPKAFLKKYKWTGAMFPEMVIMAYRKLPKKSN